MQLQRLPPPVKPEIGALTGIRFLAALYVVIFHYYTLQAVRNHSLRPLQLFLSHGYLAVSLFFILSGYILTYSYFDRQEQTSYLSFMLARFARLYPVYILALLLLLPFYVNTAKVFPSIAVLSMVQSWTVLPSDLPGTWNYPAWTLSVEFLFYILFPFLLALLTRLRVRFIALAAACALCILLGSAQVAIGGRVSLLSRWIPIPFLRLPEFVLGMLLARYRCTVTRRVRVSLWITSAMVAPLLLLNLHRLVILIVIPFAALLWLLAHECTTAARILAHPKMKLLGGASYSIYLLQVPVWMWVRKLTPSFSRSSEIENLLSLVLLVSLSIFVYIFFEGPSRKWIRKQAWNRTRRSVERSRNVMAE